MGVLEIIFPKIRPDLNLRKDLFEKLPSIAKTTFSGVEGLSAVWRAKVLESTGPAVQGHPGFLLMIGEPSPFQL